MTPNLHTSEVRLIGPGDPDGGGKAGLKTPVRHTPNDHTWHYVSITREDSTKLQVSIEREWRHPVRISVSNRHAVVPLRRIFYSDVSRAEPYVSVCNRSSRRATPGMVCRIFSRASGVFAFLEEGIWNELVGQLSIVHSVVSGSWSSWVSSPRLLYRRAYPSGGRRETACIFG